MAPEFGMSIFLLLLTTVGGARRHNRKLVTSSALVHELFNSSNYVPDLLPQCSVAERVTVKIGMALRGILDVDEPRQIVKMNVWLRWGWNDCRLRWNVSTHSNIKHLVVSSHRIWIPDITLYDSADGHFEDLEKTRAVVSHTGDVQFNAPAIITFTCPMHIKFFPFDRQLCHIKFASWSYNGYDLDVSNASLSADISVFVDNGEWNLIQIPAKRHIVYYSCCSEPYPDVTFYMQIQREHLYYVFNLVMPCILISAVAMLVFYLPPESGEKISLGITVLLSLCVFLLMVSERMPATSETVPLIAQYFASTICLVSMSCAVTVVILHIHHKAADGRNVPRWAKVLIIDYLGRFLCMQAPQQTNTAANENGIPKSARNEELCDNMITAYRNSFRQRREDDSKPETDANIHVVLGEQLDVLRQINSNIADQDASMRIASDWRKLSMILDRLFFIVFTSVTVVVTTCILLKEHEDDEMELMMKALNETA